MSPKRSFPPARATSQEPSREAVLEALPLATTDDRSLVQAAVQGHRGAARVIWRRFASLVRGLLQRTLGADEVPEFIC